MGLLTHIETEIEAIVIKVLEKLDLYHATTNTTATPIAAPVIEPTPASETARDKIDAAIKDAVSESDIQKGSEVK